MSRVNFKGCVEKEELLKIVERLWRQEVRNKEHLEDMEDDSICKICMDAPVNFFYLQLYYKLYLRTLFSRISNYETKTRKLKESQIIFYYNLSSGLALVHILRNVQLWCV